MPIRFVPRADDEGRHEVHYITVQGRADMPSAAAAVLLRDLLRDRHGVVAADAGAVDIVNLAAISETADQVGKALAAGFLIVACISLLVGGIGIMNVMLAGTAERVHEIGIRLAIGATPKSVFLEVLVESVVLCTAAAAAGELLAFGAASAIEATGSLAVHVTVLNALAGAGCACTIGLVVGLYPAQRAAVIPPNTALRVR